MNFEPRTGDAFLCIKGNRKQGIVKWAYYVYDSGQLKKFTRRNVTALLNGDELLGIEGYFTPTYCCPFCNADMRDLMGNRIHDSYECAKVWDRKVKNY